MSRLLAVVGRLAVGPVGTRHAEVAEFRLLTCNHDISQYTCSQPSPDAARVRYRAYGPGV